ncbi:hypothetical protein CLV76_13224 [Marivita geojedonensis]|nr:hypothetical protein CLV76_13224 [Marivita geojedonensis]
MVSQKSGVKNSFYLPPLRVGLIVFVRLSGNA